MKELSQKFFRLLGKIAFPVYFLIFIALDLSFRYLYMTSDSIPWTDWQPLLFSVCWGILFCGIVYALPTLARRIVMVIPVVIYGIMCIVHGVMFNLFGNFFSFADLAYSGDGAEFFSFSYLRVRIGLILCVVLAIVAVIFLAISLPKKRYHWSRPVIALAMVAAAVAGIAVQHNRLTSQVNQNLNWLDAGQTLNDADVYQSMVNVNRAMSISGIYQYLFRSFAVSSGLEDSLQYGQIHSQLDEYYGSSEKTRHPENEMSGVFEGKNLVFILMESIDTWMLTEEYMPNLYQVQQNSINFVNNYTPLYITAGTFCTEFTSNTGIVPPTTGVKTTAYTQNAFPTSLAWLFREKGYSANSFHGAAPSIYNRGNIHVNLGFEAYHGSIFMDMDNLARDSEMLNGYSLMVSDDPFFSFIITTSGHGPYTDATSDISGPYIDRARELIDPSQVPATGDDLEEYIHAIAQAMETDAFIGGFMEHLEADGHLEDTVIVFLTDHYGKYMTNTQVLMDLKGVNNTDMLSNTPFFIYSADMPAQTVEKITSSMDVAPTIANLFNLDVNYAYYVGDDIFGDGGGYVIFRGNNWYDGKIYYSPNYSGEVTDEIIQRNQEVTQRMNAVWDTLKSDYFAYLEEKT